MNIPFLLQRLNTDQDKKILLEYVSKIEQLLQESVTVENLFEYHFDMIENHGSISKLLRSYDLLKNPFELLEIYLDLYYSDLSIRESSPYFNGEEEVILAAKFFLAALEMQNKLFEKQQKERQDPAHA